jgi:hypothetical protein
MLFKLFVNKKSNIINHLPLHHILRKNIIIIDDDMIVFDFFN